MCGDNPRYIIYLRRDDVEDSVLTSLLNMLSSYNKKWTVIYDSKTEKHPFDVFYQTSTTSYAVGSTFDDVVDHIENTGGNAYGDGSL